MLHDLAAAKDLLRLGVFLVFLILGVAVWPAPAPEARRRRSMVFIAYVVAVSLLVGFTQKESWPFTTWALVHTMRASTIDRLDLVAIDANGAAWPIDPRIFQPVGAEEFDAWMRRGFWGLDQARQGDVARWIISRAEQNRERVRSGLAVGSDGWLLGRLAAPHHFDRRPLWRSAGDVGAVRYTKLQIWLEQWDVEEQARSGGGITRKLVYASR